MALTARRGSRLEDPGAELLSKGTQLWDRYGRIILGVVAAIAVAGAVTILTVRSRRNAEELAAGRLAEANALYWQGDYNRSLELSRQVAQQYPSTPSGREGHRLAGDNAYWNADYKTAVAEYRTYLDKEKSGLLSDAARRSLAYALESNRQYTEAAAAYDALVGKFDRESSAEFLAAAARSYRLANQPAEAMKRLQRLVDEFGETSYANAARTSLAELSTAPH